MDPRHHALLLRQVLPVTIWSADAACAPAARGEGKGEARGVRCKSAVGGGAAETIVGGRCCPHKLARRRTHLLTLTGGVGAHGDGHEGTCEEQKGHERCGSELGPHMRPSAITTCIDSVTTARGTSLLRYGLGESQVRAAAHAEPSRMSSNSLAADGAAASGLLKEPLLGKRCPKGGRAVCACEEVGFTIALKNVASAVTTRQRCVHVSRICSERIVRAWLLPHMASGTMHDQRACFFALHAWPPSHGGGEAAALPASPALD